MTRKIKILGTGLMGLVGSRIGELLKDKYEFENLSLENGVDITSKDQVERRVTDSPARVVLHLAAKTDVDGCEEDKGDDTKILRYYDTKKFVGLHTAWAVNVEGTRNIVETCQKTGKKLIYISTDFVFDGKNPPAGGYSEKDQPNPINWYGVTKYEGEKLVVQSGIPYLICRLAFPYRANFPKKKDFLRTIIAKLKNGEKIAMVSDEIITPTFVDDIAYALDILIETGAQGIYHLVGSSSHTPFEIGHLIGKTFCLDESLISSTTREIYFAGRAPRPWKLVLKNDKLRKLGAKMSTFEEGLKKIKLQKLI